MTASTARKGTTAADIAAAVKLGTMAPDAEVLTASDVAAERLATETAATYSGSEPVTLSATDHECGIAGCKHGAAHSGTPQPDRQIKLQCPKCGAVARMTASALAKATSGKVERNYITCGDGGAFAPAARRTYSRKA